MISNEWSILHAAGHDLTKRVTRPYLRDLRIFSLSITLLKPLLHLAKDHVARSPYSQEIAFPVRVETTGSLFIYFKLVDFLLYISSIVGSLVYGLRDLIRY